MYKRQTAQAQTNLQNLPLENSVYRGQLEAARDLLPLESGLYKQQLKAEAELLPQQTEATKNFLSASAQGVDVAERMGLAKADVSSAWKNVSDATARSNARMGVNPNSGRYAGTVRNSRRSGIRGRAGARKAGSRNLRSRTGVRSRPSVRRCPRA